MCIPGCLPGPLIVYTATETTPANQIMGEVVSSTMYTGLTDPFECAVEYMHDKFPNPRRQLLRLMARTQEEVEA